MCFYELLLQCDVVICHLGFTFRTTLGEISIDCLSYVYIHLLSYLEFCLLALLAYLNMKEYIFAFACFLRIM